MICSTSAMLVGEIATLVTPLSFSSSAKSCRPKELSALIRLAGTAVLCSCAAVTAGGVAVVLLPEAGGVELVAPCDIGALVPPPPHALSKVTARRNAAPGMARNDQRGERLQFIGPLPFSLA